MSRILRRPMFRGGRVDARGTGIASGLGYNNGGRVGLETGGNPIMARGGLGGQRPTPTGGSIMSRIRNLPYLGRMIPAMGGTAGAIGSQVVLPATIGAGLGSLADFYAKSTSTPEGYRRLKEMGGANFNFDETNPDVGEVFEYIDEGNEIGEAPGFFPRGGKEKWYKEHGYNSDGTQIVEEDIIEGETETETAKEKALRLEKEDLLAQLEAFMNPKELTEDEELAEIEKNKAMIQKAYGSGRADDASAMLLNFAGKALKPEATVKSAFGEFFEEEGKRPSERKKYKDAATTAAINAFLTGKKTLAEVEAFKEKTRWATGDKYDQASALAASQPIVKRIADTQGKYRSKKAAYDDIVPAYLYDNKDTLPPVKNINYEAEEDVKLVEENVGEVFIDLETNKVFIIVVEDGVVKKKILR